MPFARSHDFDRSPRRFRQTLLAALAASLFSAAAPQVLAASGHSANEHREKASAARQTLRAELGDRGTRLSDGLLQSLKALERASERERSQRANEVLRAAKERRQAMLELVDVDPTRALALAIPAELRNRLPKAARDQVEEEVQTEGLVVGMLIDDLERGTSEHPVFLETEAPGGTKRVRMHWADASVSDEQKMALIDRRVRVRGLRIDGQLLIGDRDQVEMAEAGTKGNNGKGNNKKDKSGTESDASSTAGSSTTMAPSTTTSPLVSGDQRTLVILANFTDKNVPCSASDVNNRLFGSTSSVDRILRESSRDAVSVSGNVVGPFTIPYSAGGTCDYRTWGAAADAAAQAAGVSLSGYSRISYAMPSNSKCGWSGIANLGGALPTRSWVLSCSTTGLFAHEISHNLRFHHASTPNSEYGDYSDPMGYSKSVQMNAANRVMAGWLPPGNVVDAGSSGTYTLAALAAPDTGAAQVVRLLKKDTSEHYYLSLRQSIGLDANLGSAYKNVVSVHKASGKMPSKTVLLARLAAGQTFTDAANAISVTAQSIDTGSATIAVQTPGALAAACSRAAPTIGLSPASQAGTPGSTLNYTVTVTNQNSGECAGSNFALSQAGPEGFSGAFANASLALAPGASATTTWSVASPEKGADGVHSIVATVAESGSSLSASKTASYVVYSDGSAPTVNISYPASGAVLASKPMSLSADAYDSGGIARVEFSVNGQLIGSMSAPPYQVRWNPKKAKGAQTLVVRARDSAGNESEASVGFTLK